MPSTKNKKANSKLLKIDMSSGSDNDDSEHELSYYAKDKVKLMKEVLKIIKPKKIKSMAPDCIKNLDIAEINSMLLEELLGISNKRLQYIFNGENVDRETSSSESEEEKPPIDVISLDDISDDDDIELCISQNEKDLLEAGFSKSRKHKCQKVKTEPGTINIKNETIGKSKKDKKKSKKSSEPKQTENLKESEKEKLMSVLELLELQARARAIRSQLAIETDKKNTNKAGQNLKVKRESESDSDAIIIDSPQHKEIVITSESEGEGSNSQLSQTKQDEDNSSFENFVKSSLLDIELPPPKKTKTSTEKNPGCSGTSNQEESQTNEANATINTIDLTEKSDEGVELDLKSRKEKFLTKIQKIKLVRNKNVTSNTIKDVIKTKDNTDQSMDSSNKPTCSTNHEDVDLIISNEANTENVLKDKIENVEQQSDGTACMSTEGSENTTMQTVHTKTENVEKSKELSTNDSSVKQNIIYCDNDEIVINLDEDEMDDMEND